MRTLSRNLLQLGSLAGFLAACGGGLPSVTPDVSISSPKDNAAVNLPADKQIAINFDSNYTLKAPGTCAGLGNCGHVYVLVDNSDCNAAGKTYNSLAVSSPGQADLSRCVMPTGIHTITLELRHDDGSSVKTLLDSPVTGKVTITAQ